MPPDGCLDAAAVKHVGSGSQIKCSQNQIMFLRLSSRFAPCRESVASGAIGI